MKNPILNLFRKWSLRRIRCEAPSALLPMKDVRTAVVLIDGRDEGDDSAVAARLVQRLLTDRGIDVKILCARKQNLDCIGRFKKDARIADGEDLFLCLATDPDLFAAEYEARSRKARFKVGRRALPGTVYDLVVASPAPDAGPDDQSEAFTAILDILDKIQ
ncbi:MAG: hypothetical protein K5910_02860 [Bacteroidales bacterium]|nr:hypothetical protein [Bacteroidales bacterium]